MRKLKIILLLLLPVLIMISSQLTFSQIEYGFSSDYTNDIGIINHPSLIFATGFDTLEWPSDLEYTRTLPTGYEHTIDPFIVLSGEGALQIQQKEGTHQPSEFHPDLPDLEIVYLRWYRRYENIKYQPSLRRFFRCLIMGFK